jgi:hypothetical protein
MTMAKRVSAGSLRIGRGLCGVVLLLAFRVGWADSGSIARCIHDVGEFGNEVVQMCANEDVAAEKALAAYPENTKAIVARCTRNVEQTGWVVAKRCADKDIAAAGALADYPQAHQPLIRMCTRKVGDLGQLHVKACVDQEIAAGQAPRQD